MMRLFTTFLKSLILLAITLPVMLVVLAVSREPATPRSDALSEQEIEEIQQLVIDNDPRLMLDNEQQRAYLTETEVNALLTYYLTSNPPLRPMWGKVELLPDAARIKLTLRLPPTPFGRYVNLRMTLVQAGDRLAPGNVTLGALDIPARWVAPLVDMGRRQLSHDDNYRLFHSLADTVSAVELYHNAMELHLAWRNENLTDIQERARRLFIDEEERHRLLRYYAAIGEIANDLPAGNRRVSLNEFLRPLFSRASGHTVRGADPMAENRSLFIAMSVYLTDLSLADLLGNETAGESPRRLNVTVAARRDLAQHIVLSAAISASAGARIADILSIYKEVHDSRYRTGFSFSDITANQVGAALGHLSTADSAQARRIQELMSASRKESDYMPEVSRADGISEQEFIKLYRDRNSPQYHRRLQEIRDSIAGRPVFQGASIDFTGLN